MFTMPRVVAGYIATAILGLLAALHVGLPPTLTQPALLVAILLVAAAVSTVVRVRRTGAPEADAKAWWQSKTIWTSVVAAGVSVLALFKPEPGIDATSVVAVIMTLFGLVNAWLYPTVAQPIASVDLKNSPPPPLLVVGLLALGLALTLPSCASTDEVRLDVDKAFIVAEVGFTSVQQSALAGIRSGAISGTARDNVIDLVAAGQRAEDSAITARRLADAATEAAALSRLSSVVAALAPAVKGN